jgi:hypothetical protein
MFRLGRPYSGILKSCILNAWGWSAQPKHVAYIVIKLCCVWWPYACQYLTGTYTMCAWNNLMHTENNVEIIYDNCDTNTPKLGENWPLTLQWHWSLNSNYCPGQRGFNFKIPLYLLMTIRCTNASRMWRIKGQYKTSRPVLEGWKNNMTEELKKQRWKF